MNINQNIYSRIAFKVTILLITAALGACASTPDEGLADATSSSNSATQNQKKASEVTFSQKQYLIGIDDIIQVSVWRNPELTVTVPVRPDGKVSLPLIGDVRAGGLPPMVVAANIEKKLRSYIRSPKVAVILTELRSHEFLTRIRVTGAVRTPSSMPYRQGMTVLDAVLQAGGVNDFAAAGRSKLYRKVNGKVQVINVDLDDILNEGALETNLILIPGDVLTVPERLF
ncbi:MAG: XrtA/PEP-CTERM system exopolysaccharide export protein [Acidiferrobacterales bacterium]